MSNQTLVALVDNLIACAQGLGRAEARLDAGLDNKVMDVMARDNLADCVNLKAAEVLGRFDTLRVALEHYADEHSWPAHRQQRTYPAVRGGYLYEVYQPGDIHPPNKHGWEVAARALGRAPESSVQPPVLMSVTCPENLTDDGGWRYLCSLLTGHDGPHISYSGKEWVT